MKAFSVTVPLDPYEGSDPKLQVYAQIRALSMQAPSSPPPPKFWTPAAHMIDPNSLRSAMVTGIPQN